jgi:hypothetical protein
VGFGQRRVSSTLHPPPSLPHFGVRAAGRKVNTRRKRKAKKEAAARQAADSRGAEKPETFTAKAPADPAPRVTEEQLKEAVQDAADKVAALREGLDPGPADIEELENRKTALIIALQAARSALRAFPTR